MKLGFKIALLAVILFFSDCKKKDKDPVADPGPAPAPAPAPINLDHKSIAQYDADNKTYTRQVGSNVGDGLASSASLASSSTGTSTADYEYYFYDTKTNVTIFEVEKGTIYTPGIGRPGAQAFRDFFAPGTVAYSPTKSPAELDGIVIRHLDDSGTSWSSRNGSGDQTGSLFTIVSSKEVTAFGGGQQMKIYATFNCKVYDDNGNSKTLTNGKLVAFFENM